MMVGNDQPQAQRPGKAGLLLGGDAAVHGDEQAAAVVIKGLDGGGVQAIALAQTVGDVIGAVCPAGAQILDHDAGGGDAVHIVIAVDRDLHPVPEGAADLLHGQIHVLQQIGVVDPIQGSVQKGLCLFPGIKAPGRQHTGRKPAEPQLTG